METTPKHKTLKRIALIFVLVLVAFLAGISGEFFTRTYLSNFAFFRDLYFTGSDTTGQRELVIRQPNKVVVEQDVMLNQQVGNVQPAVLGIYTAKVAGKNLSDNLYLSADRVGQALVLTSDGWLISSGADITGSQIVLYKNKSYAIEKVVKDEATHAVFIKISAQNLPVVKLSDLSQTTNGEQVFVYDSLNQQIHLANIIDLDYKPIFNKADLIASSQDFSRKILISDVLPANLSGSPVFDLSGEIIGVWDQSVTAGTSQVIPINYISPIDNQILKGEKIRRPYLGINYIDLGKVAMFSALTDQNKGGAYVQAVAADSPLSGKVVKGDIILSLENQDLDANTSLVDLLVSYKPGQQVKIKYSHLSKEQELSVTLK